MGIVVLGTPGKATRIADASTDAAYQAMREARGAEPLQIPERRALARSRGDLFGPPAVLPHPATIVVATTAPVVPAVPIAPQMPYRFAGRLIMGSEKEMVRPSA